MKSLTIIVPIFNEEEVIPFFLDAVNGVISKLRHRYTFEFLFIDDGSSDNSVLAIAEYCPADPARVLKLSRNFGKEAALSAGLDHAESDAVILIDVDLQDPPGLIEKFLTEWEKGYQVVYGVRKVRRKDSFVKRASAGLFYRIFNLLSDIHIPEHAGDFRLLDAEVVTSLRRLPERARFTKGLYAWAGFRSVGIPYERPSREKGQTKWSYWRLWNFALDGILSFSDRPLRLFTYTGLVISTGSILYAANTVFKAMFLGIDTKGYASLMTAITFLGGLQLLFFGILGEYLGRVFLEVKQRPRYLIMQDIRVQKSKSEKLPNF